MAIIPRKTSRRPAAGTDVGADRKQITVVITNKQFKLLSGQAKKMKVSFAEALRNAIDASL